MRIVASLLLAVALLAGPPALAGENPKIIRYTYLVPDGYNVVSHAVGGVETGVGSVGRPLLVHSHFTVVPDRRSILVTIEDHTAPANAAISIGYLTPQKTWRSQCVTQRTPTRIVGLIPGRRTEMGIGFGCSGRPVAGTVTLVMRP